MEGMSTRPLARIRESRRAPQLRERAPGVTYLPTENHGVIGDLHTVALVGTDGSIDWLCFPRFDSPGLFSALLDEHKGGRFRIAPALPACMRPRCSSTVT
jgi:hypothetical protein